MEKWPQKFLYIDDTTPENNAKLKDGDPGYPGHWNIKRGANTGAYLLSIESASATDMFLYMDDTLDGNLRGSSTDPGQQGQWYFAKIKLEKDD